MEKGRLVKNGFEYNSAKKKLSVDQIKKYSIMNIAVIPAEFEVKE